MALTDFGKAIRTARIETDATLSQMADAIGATPAFLSAIETGRKKIPLVWIEKIDTFFKHQGKVIPHLQELATVANGEVSVAGLSPAQQMLVAGFARTNLDSEQLKKFEQLLSKSMKG
jgi:transcriptional regulator with XRE-family HTH domain